MTITSSSLNAGVVSCPIRFKFRMWHKQITVTARWQTAFILVASHGKGERDRTSGRVGPSRWRDVCGIPPHQEGPILGEGCLAVTADLLAAVALAVLPPSSASASTPRLWRRAQGSRPGWPAAWSTGAPGQAA